MNSRVSRLALTTFLLLLCQTVFAEERISRYESDITVAENGILTVRETIQVEVEGLNIRHGIYRDLPSRTGIDVQEVLLDGKRERHALEYMGGFLRIRIGRGDRNVSNGTHVYSVSYRTGPQIRFLTNYDELSWNVTGNGWQFPIDSAEATVHLPGGASVLKSMAYTGTLGSTAQDASADSALHFVTTKPLERGGGLTISVQIGKGVLRQPTTAERFTAVVSDQALALVSFLGILALVCYYVAILLRIRRDSAPKRVSPVSRPPQGLTPAAVRFVSRMKYDTKTFIVAMVGIAVKGFWTISNDEGVYTLKRTGTSEAGARLSRDERAVAALVADIDEVTLRNTNSGPISKAIRTLSARLKEDNYDKYFSRNTEVWVRGLAIFGGTVLVMIAVSVLRNLSVSPIPVVGLLLQLGLAFFFLPFMKARTPAGIRLSEEIAGFRLFLTSGGEVTQETFDELLPYAMALDVEDVWSRRFSGAVKDKKEQPDFAYSPLWLVGDPFPLSGAYLFTRGMSSSVDSARVDPNGSAGSSGGYDAGGFSGGGGGGGFSGGGGGGGGGGGW